MATLHEVARAAGVSPTTVSRYLNKNLALPEATSEKIETAIKALNYRPNLLAKRLSTGKTEAISLVIPDISNPFFAELAGAAEREADKHGYAVFISSTHGERRKELAALEKLSDRHVDGLILAIEKPDDGTLAQQIAKRRDIVVIDEDIAGPRLPRIFVDNERGAYEAVNHLIAAGHRNIAVVSGPVGIMSAHERLAGALAALQEAKIPISDENILMGGYDDDFGVRMARKIMALTDRPSAVFAASDYVAIGMMRAFKQGGIRVPHDISMIGFDDVSFCEMIEPPLTTVRQPIKKLGSTAIQCLLDLISNKPTTPLTRLPLRLIERQSVARLQP